jgi:membrane protease YdiL (CAAX protease family)
MRPSAARNLVALGLGLLPPYAVVLFVRVTQGRLFTLAELVLYPLVIGTGCMLVMLGLVRFVCREPLSVLSPGAGSWRRDVPAGVILAVAFVVFMLAAQPLLARLSVPHRNPDGMTLIVGLLEHPWLMLVWFGPVLWIGVAGFEEVSRVFLLTRLMEVWPGDAGRVGAVVAATVMAGLTHAYQGPAGVVTTGAMGLACSVFFVRRGRLWPLVIAHALYDAWSIGMALASVAGWI